MTDGMDIGKKVLAGVILFVIIYFIFLQLSGLALEANVSKVYVEFYTNLALSGLIIVIGTTAFGIKYGDVLGLSKTWKLLIVSGWVIFIIFITFSQGQIIPIPKASMQDMQLTKGTELYTASVVPGILEDINILWGLPLIMTLAILLVLEYLGGFEIGAMHIIVVGVIACFIASVGYNIWVIPGFTSAHIPAYGGQQAAYLGAWVFSFGQSLVYLFTGWFLPIAHIIHNALLTYGQLYQVAVGPLSVVGG